MPQGLQVYNANGELALDLSDSITRVLGRVRTDSSGSATNDDFSTGTPFYILYRETTNNNANVVFSGNTISWTANISGGGYYFSIVYGVY